MSYKPNHPFVVWASCILWIASIFSVTWSLTLFFCLGEILVITHTDVVNAITLLSGIVMIPTNFHMLYMIANGERVQPSSRVLCCPLWLCLVWIILINIVGAAICLHRILMVGTIALESLTKSMDNYRTVARYKRFFDTLQWSLKCCGINSYKDWFKHDWCDKVRDYEWNPAPKRSKHDRKLEPVTDSVPLSCCKSGSCVSNFLLELGTHSIHTRGCCDPMFKIIMFSMNFHLAIFLLVIIVEAIVLHYIYAGNGTIQRNFQVRHLMAVNKNFDDVSINSSLDDDYDEVEDCLPSPMRTSLSQRRDYRRHSENVFVKNPSVMDTGVGIP